MHVYSRSNEKRGSLEALISCCSTEEWFANRPDDEVILLLTRDYGGVELLCVAEPLVSLTRSQV